MFKKLFSVLVCVTAIVASMSAVIVSAEEKHMYDVIDTDNFTTYFGSGYRHYEDSVNFDIDFVRDGRMCVGAECVQEYSAEDLDGDYIKFCSITYDSNKFFIRPYWGYNSDTFERWKESADYNGVYYIQTDSKSVDGTVTESIWCKHGEFGIKAQTVFCFNLLPIEDIVDDDIVFCGRTYHLKTDLDLLNSKDDVNYSITNNTSDAGFKDAPETAPVDFYKYFTVESTAPTPETAPVTDATVPDIPLKVDFSIVKGISVVTETETTVTTTITTVVTTQTEVSTSSEVPATVITEVSTAPEAPATLSEETTVIKAETKTSIVSETSATLSEETTTNTELSVNVEESYSIFDVNKDGCVNFNDVIALVNYIFQK